MTFTEDPTTGRPPLNRLFKPSVNCQDVVDARRVAFIIDGESYFGALYESFLQAKRSIIIVGWDLHSDTQLVRGSAAGDYPPDLGSLLNTLVSENERLHVYLLVWDFSMIYALEREFFPRYKLKWRTHKRIHFCLDGCHPIGGSQHQKIVVVDGTVGFVGGFDVSKWRWDTPAHHLDDDRRIDPDGNRYPPFHDVQMIVDGEAGKALSQIAVDRWFRATGSHPVVRENDAYKDPWPSSITPDAVQVQVAVARTLPAYKKRKAIREVEQLYLDSIPTARDTIYIENQYLSSHRIGQALQQQLEAKDGPEVVIVLPQKTGGWLEQHTMDVLRGRILGRLRDADRYDRLRTFYPRITENPDCTVMVHAKVMVIDDHFVRVGSSNLSNRSMGLDSECDLAIEAGDSQAVRAAIFRFRNRLIAEHTGTDAETVEERLEATASLIEAIDSFDAGERALVPLSGEIPPEVDQWVPEAELLDPEKPVEPDELLDYLLRHERQSFAYRHLLKIVLLIAGVLVLAALWRWTPVGQWIDLQSAQAAGQWIRQQPLTPLLVVVTYILGGLIAVPVTLMITATVIVFGPWWGVVYALAGSVLSALLVFGLGRLLGRDAVRRLAGSLLNRLSQNLSDAKGLATIITFRILPVAPFAVVNLIAGVSEIRARDFAMGTAVGMLPGVITIALLANRLVDTLRHPDVIRFTALGGAMVLAGGGLIALRQWIKHKRGDDTSRSSASPDAAASEAD